MDLSETVAPNSDQLNADDLIAGPRTFTVERVTKGSDEQPANIHLVEIPGRPYRPSKSMRRVLIAAWGKDTSAFAGRSMTLYRDPEVKFGRDTVGGIKVSHLSHIDNPLTVALTITRGKRAPHRVDVLTAPARPTAPTPEQVAACTSMDELRAMWQFPELHEAIKARKAELESEQTND